MYKVGFLVPPSHLEEVKLSLFAQGAGEIGDYKHCAWQVLGEGQFLPNERAKPFLGEKNETNRVAEYYVQVICVEANIRAVIAALKDAHPYEEPAYDVVKLEKF